MQNKPLQGIRVIEIAGLAPAPFCGLVLADFGADVVRVDRLGANGKPAGGMADRLTRGKRSVCIDLKSKHGVEVLMNLVANADVLIEPFRPGVMEKLGLGPEVLTKQNPRLVYARLTGWGQFGSEEVVRSAGHDINYLALSGMLSTLRRKDERPLPPINLLADFAGGGLMCALGIMMALFQRERTATGQIVDAAMVDGVAYLSSFIFHAVASGMWSNKHSDVGSNMLDSGAHFYDTYECEDGLFVAVGAIEPAFFRDLVRVMGFPEDRQAQLCATQMSRNEWPKLRAEFAAVFKSLPRDQWVQRAWGSDACLSPVLSMEEAARHPHNVVRNVFSVSSATPRFPFQPNAAPQLSLPQHVRERIAAESGGERGGVVMAPLNREGALLAGKHTVVVLEEFGVPRELVGRALESKAIFQLQDSKL